MDYPLIILAICIGIVTWTYAVYCLGHMDGRRAQKKVPAPPELIIFHDMRQARRAGFKGQSHPRYEHLMAWWPGLGMQGLLCRTPQRVTVPTSILNFATPEGRLEDLLRRRQQPWGDNILWVEV
ncbi:hypothetical protein AEAC466_04430 [Asticcacaulis sp. AC466]|uniref:hypothetical protein n=1 Tax=Asticcacaulis sp. AC466 TaxID=1282362 RepID=UPI0003C40A0C|nr:hypothetical protein [Asticcacaulis sp. AC466]ESQ85417.1 hypothetical protein AEAC466_04430 [Asticcacaulis sp. AC466]